MAAAIYHHNQQRNNHAWMAWHIAVLSKVKKMPKLGDLMINLDNPSRVSRQPEPWEVSFAKMNVWAMQSKRKH